MLTTILLYRGGVHSLLNFVSHRSTRVGLDNHHNVVNRFSFCCSSNDSLGRGSHWFNLFNQFNQFSKVQFREEVEKIFSNFKLWKAIFEFKNVNRNLSWPKSESVSSLKNRVSCRFLRRTLSCTATVSTSTTVMIVSTGKDSKNLTGLLKGKQYKRARDIPYMGIMEHYTGSRGLLNRIISFSYVLWSLIKSQHINDHDSKEIGNMWREKIGRLNNGGSNLGSNKVYRSRRFILSWCDILGFLSDGIGLWQVTADSSWLTTSIQPFQVGFFWIYEPYLSTYCWRLSSKRG